MSRVVRVVRVGWLDCSCGVSGDMLLGALHGVGALTELPALVASLEPLGVSCIPAPTIRHGLAATSVEVRAPSDQPLRRLDDVLAIVAAAAAPASARDRASTVFRRLAAIEAAVHGAAEDEVHFHEVGAVDSILDVLGVCLGLDTLGLDRLVVSPIALGGGTVAAGHGTVAVPTPAALGLLTDSGLSGYGGPVDVELATPTGVALLAEWATATGPLPAMSVEAVGVGAGARELPDRANVLRLVLGTPVAGPTAGGWQVIEANVDDMDPRMWPGVLDRLLEAGAADAWLTPILMKKGRPAHTVSALVDAGSADAVRDVLTTETSTIGVRAGAVTKHALDRSWLTVDVDGQPIRVKLAHADGRRTNLSPEFDDVVAAARALDGTVKDVLARATAAAVRELDR